MVAAPKVLEFDAADRTVARARRCLFALLALVAACSGAPPPTPTASNASGPTLTAAQSSRAAEPAKSAPGAVLQPEGRRAALVLELPSVDAFLSTPLPMPRPERYRSFAQTSRIHFGRSHLRQVDLFPGEALLLAVSDDEATVRVYERRSGRLVGNHVIPGFRRFETAGVVAWPEGAPRFVSGSLKGLLLYDALTGQLLETIGNKSLGDLRWSPDRRILVARGGDRQSGVLHFYARIDDANRAGASASLKELGTLTFPERVDAWDLSADNRLLATTHYPSGHLVVADLRTGSDVLRVPGPHFGGDVAFSPDGRLLATGGRGLLLVDLVNPQRRAFRSHFYNNIGHVRFSPSGDAVVASSYDGHLRVFRYETVVRDGRTSLALTLAQTLRHERQANVYSFVFEANGDGIVSVSGDQTVRTFRAPKPPTTSTSPATPVRTFHSLGDWTKLDPEAARPFPPAPEPSMRDGHYHPPLLDGSPRPSRIRPGHYACKVDLMYKLRDCAVWKNEKGHTLLRFAPDNLLALEGVLYDDGPVVRFEGWLNEPSTVVGCKGCEKQPMHGVFRGAGNRWQGLLRFRDYYDPYTPPELPAPDEKIESADDRFPMLLEFRAAAQELPR
jgi:hypothetical protein